MADPEFSNTYQELVPGRTFNSTAGTLQIVRQLKCSGEAMDFLAMNGDQYCVLRFPDGYAAQLPEEDSGSIGLELMAYRALRGLGIPVPGVFGFDMSQNYLVREFISGPTGGEILRQGNAGAEILAQLEDYGERCARAGLCIDYSPELFVLKDDTLCYLRYAFESFSEERSFATRGRNLWERPDVTGGMNGTQQLSKP